VYAGYWEFPGGKVEPEEPVLDALVRELHEELGIEVRRAYPWIVLTYLYPHAHVRLHFYRVLGWEGDPHPREEQGLAWNRVDSIAVAPVLPANGPVLRALSLPSTLAITRAGEVGVHAQLDLLDAALARGLKFVMVREKQLAEAELLAFAQEVVARCRAAGARVVVNSSLPVARVSGADGLHLTAAQLLVTTARPDVDWCGASCHDVAELTHAARLGLDYVVLGPVLPTASHPGATPLGWKRFSALLGRYPLPAFALGGLQLSDLETAWLAGAHGIAMMRSAWEPAQGS
jgi:8-oxo-dGTP diphosphatase